MPVARRAVAESAVPRRKPAVRVLLPAPGAAWWWAVVRWANPASRRRGSARQGNPPCCIGNPAGPLRFRRVRELCAARTGRCRGARRANPVALQRILMRRQDRAASPARVFQPGRTPRSDESGRGRGRRRPSAITARCAECARGARRSGPGRRRSAGPVSLRRGATRAGRRKAAARSRIRRGATKKPAPPRGRCRFSGPQLGLIPSAGAAPPGSRPGCRRRAGR